MNTDTLRSFVHEIAELAIDGDVVNGEEYVLENDAAWSTLTRLVEQARQLRSQPCANCGHAYQEHRQTAPRTCNTPSQPCDCEAFA